MAAAYNNEVAHTTIHPSATSIAVTVGNAPGAGNLVVLGATTTNDFLTSVTDARSNTWTVSKTTSNSVAIGQAWTMQDAAPLQAGDAITLHFGATVFNGAVLIESFTGVAAAPQDVTASTTGTSTARDGGTTGVTSQAAEVAVMFAGVSGADTSFTPSGATAFTTAFVADGSAASIDGCYVILSGTGAQHITGTGSANVAWCGVTTTFKATVAGGGTSTAPNLLLLGVG